MKIDKLEAARRQMDTAIKLFFEDEDPISTHTLIMSSARILNDMTKQSESSFSYRIEDYIRPGREKEFFSHFNKAANFFKHADRDPGDVLENFDEETNQYLLMITASLYANITGKPTKSMSFYFAWASGVNPDLLVEDIDDSIANLIKGIGSILGGRPRKEQIKMGHDVFMQI